jgi:tetratricopeptide (TPR) repeat protein
MMDYREQELAGQWQEAISQAEHLLEQNPGVEEANELHIWLGGMLWKVGRMADAQSHLDAAQSVNPLLQAQKLYNQGELYYIQAGVMGTLPDFDPALDAHEEALSLRREIDDKPGQTHSLSRLGVIQEQLGNPEKAKEYYMQSLALAEEIEYPHGKTRPLTHLGLFKLKDGDFDAAAEYLERALRINQEIGNVERLMWGHMNVGQLIVARDNDPVEALEHYQEALTLSQQTDFKLALVVAHMRLGSHYQSLGQPEQFKKHFMSLRDIAAHCGYQAFVDHANAVLGGAD